MACNSMRKLSGTKSQLLLNIFLIISFSSGFSVPVYKTYFFLPLSSTGISNFHSIPRFIILNCANVLAFNTSARIPIPSNVLN